MDIAGPVSKRVIVAIVLCVVTLLHANAVPAQRPSFEVASIKPTPLGKPSMSVGTSRGRFIARGATVSLLLQYSYHVKNFQIAGGPDWLDSDRFDIDAKFNGEDNAENDQKVQAMLQSLLADRFKLQLHEATQILPVYELVAAKNGSTLALSDSSTQPRIRGGPGQILATHTSMPELASHLSLIVRRQVLDRTNLAGTYDFNLKWTPNENQRPVLSSRPDAPPPDPLGPALFTALPEQLGLRLESSKAPIEVLVIDHVQKPAAN
jgi:uncharacterized protein (TIGR03435 family)